MPACAVTGAAGHLGRLAVQELLVRGVAAFDVVGSLVGGGTHQCQAGSAEPESHPRPRRRFSPAAGVGPLAPRADFHSRPESVPL
jgi:uncharacterized protein YbjT (DUF2867 family)